MRSVVVVMVVALIAVVAVGVIVIVMLLRRLRPLLDLPVEIVLPAHGEPTDRAVLERVLS